MNYRALGITAILAASLTSTTSAQEIVGITATNPVVLRQDMGSSNCGLKRCLPTGFPRQAAIHAGGTAYDSRLRGVWITNGLTLANVNPETCRYTCPQQRIPLPPQPGVRHYATGLAYVDSGAIQSTGFSPGYLFVSYNSGWIARLEVRQCVVRAQFCRFPVPADGTIAGLATDDVNRRLYTGVTTTSGLNIIYTSNLDGAWCRPDCKFEPPVCNNRPLRQLSGLAFDPCKHTLFATDGRYTIQYAVARAPRCDLRTIKCCPNTTEPFTGLCLIPDTDIRSVGRSCTTRACENCPTMRAELLGDPVLGNPFFGVGLRNAPNKTQTAILALGVGACNPVGVNLGFCETIKATWVPRTFFFSVTPNAVNGCNRNISIPWAVPLQQNLCGLRLSFQWLTVCRGIPQGIGVTNCVDFKFAGS